jgi:hypothetical protein
MPNRHAWCRTGDTIVDITVTQFGRQCKAIHVTPATDPRYVEVAARNKAIDDIMDNWRGRESDVYVALALILRKRSLGSRSPVSSLLEMCDGSNPDAKQPRL